MSKLNTNRHFSAPIKMQIQNNIHVCICNDGFNGQLIFVLDFVVLRFFLMLPSLLFEEKRPTCCHIDKVPVYCLDCRCI